MHITKTQFEIEQENIWEFDPITARFLSADPFVPNPFSSQDYNRYSYVLNNPLKYTDPSGYTQINWGHNPSLNNMVTQLANEQGAWQSQFGWNNGYINYNAFGTSQFIGGGGGGGGLQLSDFGLSEVSSGQLSSINSMLEGTGIQITGYSSTGVSLTIGWYEGQGGIIHSGDGWFAQTAQTYAFKNFFIANHNLSDPSRWGNFTGTKNNQYYFEGVKVYEVNISPFNKGAAVTIPNVGIFVGTGEQSNMHLLRHEFGHILQYKKWGGKIWSEMAITSLFSASENPDNHMYVWSEWTANFMSYNYFDRPSDWKTSSYPFWPDTTGRYSYPPFSNGIYDLMINWLGK